VAAFAVIYRRRPQAPGIIYTSQFARLQKTLNTAPFSFDSDRIAIRIENSILIVGTNRHLILASSIFFLIQVDFEIFKSVDFS